MSTANFTAQITVSFIYSRALILNGDFYDYG